MNGKSVCGASQNWNNLATRFWRIRVATLFPRGRHPGVSSSFPHHRASSFPRQGHLLQNILPSIAFTLRPLRDKLHGGKMGSERLEWSAVTEAAFVAAKKALLHAFHSSSPPHSRGSFITGHDASATHMGVCHQQQLPGRKEWKPLGFFSKKLETPQHSAFDRELFSCYSEIRHFQYSTCWMAIILPTSQSTSLSPTPCCWSPTHGQHASAGRYWPHCTGQPTWSMTARRQGGLPRWHPV
jgi:hypothetical protein